MFQLNAGGNGSRRCRRWGCDVLGARGLPSGVIVASEEQRATLLRTLDELFATGLRDGGSRVARSGYCFSTDQYAAEASNDRTWWRMVTSPRWVSEARQDAECMDAVAVLQTPRISIAPGLGPRVTPCWGSLGLVRRK